MAYLSDEELEEFRESALYNNTLEIMQKYIDNNASLSKDGVTAQDITDSYCMAQMELEDDDLQDRLTAKYEGSVGVMTSGSAKIDSDEDGLNSIDVDEDTMKDLRQELSKTEAVSLSEDGKKTIDFFAEAESSGIPETKFNISMNGENGEKSTLSVLDSGAMYYQTENIDGTTNDYLLYSSDELKSTVADIENSLDKENDGYLSEKYPSKEDDISFEREMEVEGTDEEDAFYDKLNDVVNERQDSISFWKLYNDPDAESVDSELSVSDLNDMSLIIGGEDRDYKDYDLPESFNGNSGAVKASDYKEEFFDMVSNASFTELDAAGAEAMFNSDLYNSRTNQVMALSFAPNDEFGEGNKQVLMMVPDNSANSAMVAVYDEDHNAEKIYAMESDDLNDVINDMAEKYGWSYSFDRTGGNSQMPWNKESVSSFDEVDLDETEVSSDTDEKQGWFKSVFNNFKERFGFNKSDEDEVAAESSFENYEDDDKTDKENYFNNVMFTAGGKDDVYTDFSQKTSSDISNALVNAKFSPDTNIEEREGNPVYTVELVGDENGPEATLEVFEDGHVGYFDRTDESYYSVKGADLSAALEDVERTYGFDGVNRDVNNNSENYEDIYSLDGMDYDMQKFADAGIDDELETKEFDSENSMDVDKQSSNHDSYVKQAQELEKETVVSNGYGKSYDYEME